MRSKRAIFVFSLLFLTFFTTGFVVPFLVKNNVDLIEQKLSQELSTEVQLTEISIKWNLKGPYLRFYDFSFLGEGLHFKRVDVGLDVFRSIFNREVVLSFFSLKGFNYETSIKKIVGEAGKKSTSNISLGNILKKVSKMTTEIFISNVDLIINKENSKIKISNIKTKIIPGLRDIECSLSFVLNDRTFLNGEINLIQDENALSSKRFFFEGQDFHLKGHFRHPVSSVSDERSQFYIHFNNTYFHKLLEEALAMFPSSQVIKQLKSIVVKGVLSKGHINIIKEPKKKSLDIEGDFDINKLDLRFSDEWPELKEIKTRLQIKNDSATATIAQGYTNGIGVQRAIVYGKELYGEKATLDIRSLLSFNGKYASAYLQETPMWNTLSFIGGMVNFKNSFEMQLALDIPIFNVEKSKILGTLLFKPESVISFYNSNYELKHLSGGVTFNEKGITRSKVTGFFFEDEFVFKAKSKLFEFFSYPLTLKYKVGRNKSKVEVEKAILPEYVSKGEIVNKPVDKPTFPALEFHAKYIDYNGKILNQVSANRVSIEKGFVWENINAFGREISLKSCQLTWLSDIELNSNAICKIEVHNYGNAMLKMGIADSIEDGDGFIEYRSQWEGDISKYDVMGVNSSIDIDIKDMKIKSSKSRTRQFLNYLTFNLFESESKAIKIEKFQGELIQNGNVLNTKNFLITLPSMDMSSSGQYFMDKKSVNLDVVLNLNITGLMKTYGFYSAVALANPAVFALAWIPGLRQFSKHTIGKLFEQEYNVTGAVEAPVIKVKKFANIPIPGFQKK